MESAGLSFREKSAWVSFVTILVVFVPFFWNSWRQFRHAVPGRDAVGVAFALLATFVALEVLLHIVLAWRSPAEARSPRDEREQLIDMRATRVAFHVFVAGALGAAAALHLTRSAWVIQQLVLLVVVVAELVRFGGQIVLFRQDA